MNTKILTIFMLSIALISAVAACECQNQSNNTRIPGVYNYDSNLAKALFTDVHAGKNSVYEIILLDTDTNKTISGFFVENYDAKDVNISDYEKILVKPINSTNMSKNMSERLTKDFSGFCMMLNQTNQTNNTGNQTDNNNTINQTNVTNLTLTASLRGCQEVPKTNSTATGEGNFNIDTKNNLLFYNITYRDLSSNETQVHIHGPAEIGKNAPPVFTLPLGNNKTGYWQYDQQWEDELLEGEFYVNVHSQNYQDGEIRGQIMNKTLICPENDTNITENNSTNTNNTTNNTNGNNATNNTTNNANLTYLNPIRITSNQSVEVSKSDNGQSIITIIQTVIIEFVENIQEIFE